MMSQKKTLLLYCKVAQNDIERRSKDSFKNKWFSKDTGTISTKISEMGNCHRKGIL